MNGYIAIAASLHAYVNYLHTTSPQFALYSDIRTIIEWVPELVGLTNDVLPGLTTLSARKIQAFLPTALGGLSSANLLVPAKCAEVHNNLMTLLEYVYHQPPQTVDDVNTNITTRVVAVMKDYIRLILIRVADAVMLDIQLIITNVPVPTEIYTSVADDSITEMLRNFVDMARKHSYFEAIDDNDYIIYAAAMCATTMYILDRGTWYNMACRAISRLYEIHCPATSVPPHVDRTIDWCQHQLAVAELLSYRLPLVPMVYSLPDPCAVYKRGRENPMYADWHEPNSDVADHNPKRRPRGETHH